MALILCISSSLRQASTTQRAKLFQLSPYVQAPRIVHIHDAHPGLDFETHQTLSALLPRPFRALFVTHGLNVSSSQDHDAPELVCRSIKRVGAGQLIILYIHFHKLCFHSRSQAYLRMQGGSCCAVRLPHRISCRICSRNSAASFKKRLRFIPGNCWHSISMRPFSPGARRALIASVWLL